MLWGVLLTVGWVIVVGLFQFSPAQAFDFPPRAFEMDADLATRLGAAAVLAMYNYGGYNQVCNIGEEIRDPARVVPAIDSAVDLHRRGDVHRDEHGDSGAGAVGGGRRSSRTIASLFIQRTFSDPSTGYVAGLVMTGLIIFIAARRLYATILGYSRIPFAAARDGDFFRVFAAHPPDEALPSRLARDDGARSRFRSAFSRSGSS